jgi:hypothetical protein
MGKKIMYIKRVTKIWENDHTISLLGWVVHVGTHPINLWDRAFR